MDTKVKADICQAAHRRRAPVGLADGAGPDRRHAQGRRVPPDADRPRQAGPRSGEPLGARGRLDGHHRQDRQRLPAPPRPQQRAAAGGHRQPHRHPAHRRQVRRQLRRAGRAGGGAHAQRPRHPDRSADRGGLVDQRGRLALRAGDDGLGRVRQGLHAGACLRRQGHRGQVGEGRAASASATSAPRSPARTRSAATSRPTSSRARCWRTTTRPSAWSPACSASAGTTAPSPAWKRMPARRRWRCARTRCRWRAS